MAIGKPLLITEKKTVQTPVLSAQTTPLSANVAAQKLSFADYGIGQANAKASFAVSNELVGMAEAVGKAAIYIDKTKKEHARLDMMQAWQQTDMTFAEDYAEAVTYKEKNEVAARYQESIGTRSRAYRDIGNFNLEAQKSLAALTGKSRSQLSKMHISSAQTLVSETQSGYKLQESKITDEIKANPTVDMGVKFQEYRDLQNKMVDIGMKTTQQAEFDQIQWQRGAHSIRGAVIGKEYAKSYISDGSPLPDDNEILQHYMDRTGMGLDDISSKAYVESVHDTYSKKVRQFNTEARAERLLIENSFYDEKKENDRLLKEAIVSNELTDEAVQTFMAIAESFGSAYAGEVQAQIDAYKYGSADANVVDLYSNDEAVQGYIDSGYLQNQFIDVDSVISSLPSEVNVSERAAIARKLITRNKEISTDIAKQIPTTASGVLTEIFHPDNPLGGRFRALVGDKLAVELSRGLASGKLNWKEVIGSDKDFGAIWNGVNAAVKDYYEKGKGKADPEYMKSRTNIERYEDLRSVLEKEFNSAIEDKLDFLQKKKDAVDLEKEKQLEAERRAGEEKAERDVEREIEKGKERSEKEAQEVMEKVHKTQLIEAQNRLVEYAKQLNALPRVMTDLPEKPPEKNGRQDYLDYWFGGKNWKPDLSKESGEPIDSGSPVGLSQDQLSEMQVTHEAVRVGGELLSGFSQQTPILDGPKESKENFGGMAGENQVAPPEGERSQEQSTVAEQVSQFVGDAIGDAVGTVAEVLSPSVANAEEVPPPNVPTQLEGAGVPQPSSQVISQGDGQSIYEVVKGDTLGGIANKSGITLEELQKLNPDTRGKEHQLQIGQKIRLPSGTGGPSIWAGSKEREKRFGGMKDPGGFTYRELMKNVKPAPEPKNTYSSQVKKSEGKVTEIEMDSKWSKLERRIAAQEGLVYTPYPDGKVNGKQLYSVGFGHQLTDDEVKKYLGKKVDKKQILKWFREDILEVKDQATKLADKIGGVAKGNADFILSLADMIYQGGPAYLQEKFLTAYKALLAGKWDMAAANIHYRKPEESDEESGWMKQTRDRASRFRDAILKLKSARQGE